MRMHITLLPDRGEYVKKLKGYKEKQSTKKENRTRKKRKRYLKRKSFSGILAVSMLCWIMVTGVVSAGIIKYRLDIDKKNAESSFDDYMRLIELRIPIEYSGIEKEAPEYGEVQLKRRFDVILHSFIPPGDFGIAGFGGAIYDGKTGVLIADTSDDCALLRMEDFSDYYSTEGIAGEEVQKKTPVTKTWIYEYAGEPDERLLSLYDVVYGYNDSQKQIRPDELYLSDDKFYFGRLGVYDTSQSHEGLRVETVDLTPGDTAGFIVLDPTERMEEHVVYSPVVIRKGSEKELELANNLYADDDMIDTLDGGESISDHGVFAYSDTFYTVVRAGEELSREFTVVLSFRYDFLEAHGKQIVVFLAVMMVLACVCGYFTAKYRFFRLKAHYDLEDYRRDLANALAHDLKSPLTVILGLAENLKEQVNTEKRDYYTGQIIERVKEMDHMTEQLLEYSRLEDMEDIPNKECVDVGELIKNVIKKHEASAEEKRMKFAVSGSAQLKGNAMLLHRAFDNLILNSVQHGSADSVIEIELSDREMLVSNSYDGRYNGKDTKALFEGFRKDKARTRTGGHGLGLSIAREVFRRHGIEMTISADSSSFAVRLVPG